MNGDLEAVGENGRGGGDSAAAVPFESIRLAELALHHRRAV
jgi:hypothetical protein